MINRKTTIALCS